MKTKAIFRKMGKTDPDIIAFFPELPGDMNPYRTCESYMHIGQHAAATFDFYLATRPASPVEYADLKAELESLGYDLKVARRMSRNDLKARIKAARF